MDQFRIESDVCVDNGPPTKKYLKMQYTGPRTRSKNRRYFENKLGEPVNLTVKYNGGGCFSKPLNYHLRIPSGYRAEIPKNSRVTCYYSSKHKTFDMNDNMSAKVVRSYPVDY